MFRFKKARNLRIRADYHERKASTPEFIFKVASERFSKLNFNYQHSDFMNDSVMCQETTKGLPRRKGWGKPISVARIRKLKKDRAKIENQERDRRLNRKNRIEFTVA